MAKANLLDSGKLGFTIESRVIRELGERLVKQPEIALLELIKNSYDADAERCELIHTDNSISIADNGSGMTLDRFKTGWMRIGTSSKELLRTSPKYARVITGEKGIGRFAVRYLGRSLTLESVAFDEGRGFKTRLAANFDWVVFDHNADLGEVQVPYTLSREEDSTSTGTRLVISEIRASVAKLDLNAIRTASIGVVTPYHSLLRTKLFEKSDSAELKNLKIRDPGFSLNIYSKDGTPDDGDVAKAVLDNFVLRSTVLLENEKLTLCVYRADSDIPSMKIIDNYPNSVGTVYADIRYFPARKGTFVELPVDGRKARTWVKENSGVAVFDRTFRVYPYGKSGDDWLYLSSDAAKRAREPRSSISEKHFPMDEPTRLSTQLNYMLRLAYPQQLVGVVQVAGRRSQDQRNDDDGLVAAADREGFLANSAYEQLVNLIRGAVEAIACADRELQFDLDRLEQAQFLETIRTETNEAIREVQTNPNIGKEEKVRIVQAIAKTQVAAERHEERTKERESSLEVMSLLGVVAGFMTHEFGTALDELEKAHAEIVKLSSKHIELAEPANSISQRMALLREFVTYSQGYIHGSTSRPVKPYASKPRIQQVIRVFGRYADEREIGVSVEIDSDLNAPMVPVSLYNGIALNLFTNALKAVTAKTGKGDKQIVFRAWNDQFNHYLEVSDTGIGIPMALRNRIFDPLFTTTSTNRDPLGSGMGLGLTLVRRGAESYGGRVEAIDAPPGFATCMRLRLPLLEQF